MNYFLLSFSLKKNKKYQDKHSMPYEHDTITTIPVNLNYRSSSSLIKFAKRGSMGFD